MTAGVLVAIVALIIAGDRVLAGDPLPPLSWRTVYFLVGFGAVPIIMAAQAGELVNGLVAALLSGPMSVGLMWLLRHQWWFYNWWDT